MNNSKKIVLLLLSLCLFLFVENSEASVLDSTVGIEFSVDSPVEENKQQGFFSDTGEQFKKNIAKIMLPQTGEELAFSGAIVGGIILLILGIKWGLDQGRRRNGKV